MPDSIFQAMNRYLPNTVYNTYGMSEYGGVIAANFGTDKVETCGHIIDGCSIKIVNENGERCGIAEDGEIYWLHHTYSFLGYYKDAEATANARDAEGWFRTGDIGYFDADGCLYIVGRKKDVLKYTYFNVSPAEIEHLIMRYAAVEYVCVVGIPDARYVELPAAVIVRKNKSEVTESEICGIVKGKRYC